MLTTAIASFGEGFVGDGIAFRPEVNRNDFVSVWQIGVEDLSLEISLPEFDRSDVSLQYDFTVNWGDGQSGTVTTFDDEDRRHVYAEAGEYTVVIKGIMQGLGEHRFVDEYEETGGDNPHALKLISVPNLGH